MTSDPFAPQPAAPDLLGRAALAYASRGIPVLPLHYPVVSLTANLGTGPGKPRVSWRCSCQRADCGSPGKHPIAQLVPHGVKDATTDRARLTGWWAEHPNANIGLATGHVMDVLDVDGADGAAALRQLAREHGLASSGPLVRTGSGGWHYCDSMDACDASSGWSDPWHYRRVLLPSARSVGQARGASRATTPTV
jgi:Bifunctional DNA primase/polymerase, N-terminal